MKKIALVFLFAAAAVWAWTWGDRQAQELAEWRQVWGGVYCAATGAESVPAEASVETLGRTVAKEFEAAKRGGADIRTSIGELEEKLAAATARAAVAETDLAALKRDFEARREAAVADLKAQLAEQLAAARLEVARAKEERDAAVKSFAALETQFEDVKATLEAVINVPGDSMALGEGEESAEPEAPAAREKVGKKRGKKEKAEAPEMTENPENPEIPEAPETVEAPEEPETPVVEETPEAPAVEEAPVVEEAPAEPETPEEAVVAGRGVGKSGLFLTLGYAKEGGRLRLQFTGGEELVYEGVPEEVAAKVREAGDKVDAAVRERVKGKYAAEGDEEGVWKAYKRAKKGKARVEAVWVEED